MGFMSMKVRPVEGAEDTEMTDGAGCGSATDLTIFVTFELRLKIDADDMLTFCFGRMQTSFRETADETGLAAEAADLRFMVKKGLKMEEERRSLSVCQV
jgi:hypothetical protein